MQYGRPFVVHGWWWVVSKFHCVLYRFHGTECRTHYRLPSYHQKREDMLRDPSPVHACSRASRRLSMMLMSSRAPRRIFPPPSPARLPNQAGNHWMCVALVSSLFPPSSLRPSRTSCTARTVARIFVRSPAYLDELFGFALPRLGAPILRI